MNLELWFYANLITGLAYMHIPIEMWLWIRGINLHGLKYIAGLFIAFVLLCGGHHLWMLTSFQHHPIGNVQVAIDVGMAAVSAVTSGVIYHFRHEIRGIVRTQMDLAK